MNSQCLEVTPEQNSHVDPCPCQDLCPSCDPQTPLGVTSPSLPVANSGKSCADPAKIPSSGEEPFTFETPGMCVMSFPLQKSILTVELCPPDASCLDDLENLSLEKISLEKLPMVAPEPCTLEVLDLGADEPCQAQGVIPGDPCASQSGISMDPCASQSGISKDPCASQSGISKDPCASQSGISMDPCASQSGISMDPCASQSGISKDPCASQSGISKDPCASQSGISMDPCASQSGISQSQGMADPARDGGSRTSPRSPFRLNSCTSSIVERCLSRCQSWFRGKK